MLAGTSKRPDTRFPAGACLGRDAMVMVIPVSVMVNGLVYGQARVPHMRVRARQA